MAKRIGMISYQHGCGTEFSVLLDDISFAVGFECLIDENPQPAEIPDDLRKQIKESYAQLSKARGRIFVDPKETPMIVCGCGAWVDIETVVEEHKKSLGK